MARLILIATAVFVALYLLSRRFNASQKSNEAKEVVVAHVQVVCFKKLSLSFLSYVRFYLSRIGSSLNKGRRPVKQ